ncbi:exported hypothetical protein [Burkholderia cepacia]|nr:exported hypothetical protein [Burkholderia cepacia]
MPKLSRRLLSALAASLCMSFAHAADLSHWPADSAKALNAMIAAHAHRGDYAVTPTTRPTATTSRSRCCRTSRTAAC